MITECEKCKISNLNVENVDEDRRENEESFSGSNHGGNSAKTCFYKWGCQDGKV